MKKLLLLLLLIIAAGAFRIKAQGIPTYICDTTSPDIERIGSSWHPFDLAENITQSIYHLSDFPGLPPQGFISEVFIKIAFTTPAGSTLKGLKIKMGITDMNDFSKNGWGNADFLAMDAVLDTVYYDSFYTLPVTLPAGGWWRLTLPNPYQYSLIPLPGDVPQNLVVQLSQAVYKTGNTISWLFNIYDIVYNDSAVNRRRSAWGSTLGPLHFEDPGYFVPLIGFNGYALSVDDPNKIKPFSVFPNPARDKLSLKGEIKGRYKIYNLAGKKLLEGSLRQGEFIDVGSLSAGMYFLEADGGRLKFMKQ